jgi:hypothetical protein
MRPFSRALNGQSLFAWVMVAGGLIVYVGLVFAFRSAWFRLDAALPWWVAQPLPPLVYGLLTVFCVSRPSGKRWLGLTLSLWAVHATVGVLTQLVTDSSRVFPPPVFPVMLWVLLFLFPLRDAFGRSSRAGSDRLRPGARRSAHVRGARRDAARLTAEDVPAVATDGPNPADADQEPVHPEPSLLAPETHVGRAEPPCPAAPEPSPMQRALDDVRGQRTTADMLRVSFSRIADQLPINCFTVPPERVAGRLLEAGYLLVPQGLVLAQLGEGLVRAGWEDVSKQFPSSLLAMTAAEIRQRLPEGQLVLPLDELVPQLPRELFVVGSPPMDLDGIESFPAPFQPIVMAGDIEHPSLDDSPSIAEASPAAEVSVAPALPKDQSETGAEAFPVLALTNIDLATPSLESSEEEQLELGEGVEPSWVPAALDLGTPSLEPSERTLEGRVEPSWVPAALDLGTPSLEAREEAAEVGERVEPEAWAPVALDLGTPSLEAREEAAEVGERVEPEAWASPAMEHESTVVESVEPGVGEPQWPETPAPTMPAIAEPVAGFAPAAVNMMTDDEMAAALEITALLAPVGALNVAVDSMDDVSLFFVSSPEISTQRVAAATRSMLPFLTDSRVPWRLDRLTLRGPDLALVLTPLHPGGAVLVAALPPKRSLAMLEILCGRAAARHGGPAGQPTEWSDAADEPELLEIEPSTRIRGIARSLFAVGPVTASVLHDLETEWPLYCFLPAGSDARTIGALACDISRAMRRAADSGMTLHTAVLGSEKRRLMIHIGETRSGVGILVAAGETDRPGLAYRQVVAAASALLPH